MEMERLGFDTFVAEGAIKATLVEMAKICKGTRNEVRGEE